MIITTTYRGQKVELADFKARVCKTGNGSVQVIDDHFTDGNKKIFKATIEANELLEVAKACISELEKVSGVSYQVFARVSSSDDWRRI